MNGQGKLYFRYGTMGSAKTALLLTQAYNFEERNMRYLCMKPIIDNRESANVIRSRIGIERACSWIYPEMDLYEYLKGEFERTLEVKAWVLVDEAQFLSKAQVDQLARIVDDYGVNVICYGLRTDFQSHVFEGSLRLGAMTSMWRFAAAAGVIAELRVPNAMHSNSKKDNKYDTYLLKR